MYATPLFKYLTVLLLSGWLLVLGPGCAEKIQRRRDELIDMLGKLREALRAAEQRAAQALEQESLETEA